ncbi:Glucose/arabinose dehydrogenase, beta-propeller fold [Albimonas donghaensis]|uniref:Glucose/arabinose dehydrogenase, beta-propeller fold n=1 Tax=Albimonas donghaensis TaxID=356660 RepID=A0A1H3EY46_9RHOB|nr:PQQ-dependent sugar dehydrogenase [Albimonas donghaensis]SDX83530.1 Glucose/arabinose dehydrogenase, beta-propeller fold [Albimonas donghaensis]
MVRRPAAEAFAAIIAAALLAKPAEAEVFNSSAGLVQVAIVGPAFEHPWALAFLPDFPQTGAMLVTERPGRLALIQRGERFDIEGLPPIAAGGQGGLLDMALSPDFSRTGLIYLTHSAPTADGAANTVVTRAVLDREKLVLHDLRTVLRMTSNETGGRHFGSRLAFAPDGTLFVTMGERGNRASAQDPDSHNGKVHRITPDGGIPADNPFANGGGLASIWSMGHRNPQGAAVHPRTGELWTVEHGARGGDEVNRPRAGDNHGWPEVSYGTHYSGAKIGQGETAPGFVEPVHYWDPSIAPSGAAFYDGTLFPAWRGDLFVGALKDQLLMRLEIEDGEVVGQEPLFEGAFGRVRDVRIGPDGALWFLTDEAEGRLHRVSPML